MDICIHGAFKNNSNLLGRRREIEELERSVGILRKELEENRKAEKIVFIDNLIAYKDELKGNAIVELLRQFPETLFVFLDHEEAGEPATSAGILAKKLSNVYVQIKGLSAFVTVRGGDGEGGRIDIDENKAALIHGEREIN